MKMRRVLFAPALVAAASLTMGVDSCQRNFAYQWSNQSPAGTAINNVVGGRYLAGDYAPSILVENGLYRMWWCGGNYIFYAESTVPNVNGGWHGRGREGGTFDVALGPRGVEGSFDRSDVCDPSVIKVGNQYIMFYGANNYAAYGPGRITDYGPGAENSPDVSGPYYKSTHIGMAVSDDGGYSWQRWLGPIVRPRREGCPLSQQLAAPGPFGACFYGAGQPSVFHNLNGDNRYYMIYSDDTTIDHTTTGNGLPAPPKLFVISAQNALFSWDAKLWNGSGWIAFGPQYPLPSSADALAHNEAASDWQFVDSLGMIARSRGNWGITLVNPAQGFREVNSFSYALPYYGGPEQMGLMHQPNGHARSLGAPSVPGDKLYVSFESMRTGCYPGVPCDWSNPASVDHWDLSYAQVTLTATLLP